MSTRAQAGALEGHCVGALARVRYTVLEAADAGSERVLRLLREADGSEVIAHLRDGWADTAARPGDVVHLLAAVEAAGGAGHAVCDCSTGASGVPVPDRASGLQAQRVSSLCYERHWRSKLKYLSSHCQHECGHCLSAWLQW